MASPGRAVLMMCVFGLSVLAGSQSTRTTVLSGVTVIDVERGVRVPDQDVVIRDDRILAVHRTGSRPLPSGARRIPARGLFVIPGLWDMHTHLTEPPWAAPGIPADSCDVLSRIYFAGLLTASGVTGIRDLGGDPGSLKHWRLAGHADPTGPPVPRIHATGQKLGARPVVPGAPFPLRTPEDVRVSVRLLRDAGAAHVKLEPAPAPWLARAAMEVCRREGIPCVSHISETVSPLEAAAGGMKSLEHLFLLDQHTSSLPDSQIREFRRLVERPTFLERVAYKLRLRPRPVWSAVDTVLFTHSRQRAAELFGALASSGTWVTPTLTLHDMMLRVRPRHAAARDTSLMTEPPRPGPGLESRAPDALALATRRWSLFQQLVRELRDAGVGMLAGTDIPLQSVPGYSLHMELELLQESGLTPLEALRTATLNPARYFGALDTLGTVGPGRVADLVILRADPLTDVRALANIAFVVQRGRVFTRRELDGFVDRAREALHTIRAAQAAADSRSD